jgi:NitT/TauT family transport system ATP-binding protein
MTPRPGRIETIVDIDLPRPRGSGIEDSPAFAAKVTEVRQALAHGWTGR